MYSVAYFFYWVSFVLYLLAGAIGEPMICACAWRAVGQARRRGLTGHLRWLVPMAIGSAVTLVAMAVVVGETLLRSRDAGVMAVPYVLSVLSTPFTVCGMWRLWKWLRDLPAGGGPESPRSQPAVPGVWPPPPTG